MQQISSHGLFDLSIEAEGDTWIDDHHTNEDIGAHSQQHLRMHSLPTRFPHMALGLSQICCAALALGTALSKALGDRKGIHRFGNFAAPLDEALVDVVLVSPRLLLL